MKENVIYKLYVILATLATERKIERIEKEIFEIAISVNVERTVVKIRKAGGIVKTHDFFFNLIFIFFVAFLLYAEWEN